MSVWPGSTLSEYKLTELFFTGVQHKPHISDCSLIINIVFSWKKIYHDYSVNWARFWHLKSKKQKVQEWWLHFFMLDVWGFTSTLEVLYSGVSWWHWCNGITEVRALEDPAGTLCLLNQTPPNTSCFLVKYDGWLTYLHVSTFKQHTHRLVKYHQVTCEHICIHKHTVFFIQVHHRLQDETVTPGLSIHCRI